MKKLAAIFSVLTLLALSLGLLVEKSNKKITQRSVDTITFIVPKKLPNELLPLEIKWQGLLQNKDLDNNSSVDDKENFKPSLMVGGRNYKLLGIFNNKQLPFVLLKNENNNMLKLTLGDMLPAEFTLIKITNNTIVFVNNNDRVEYKLFE